MYFLHHLVVLSIFFLALVQFSGSEIHRAKTHGGKSSSIPSGEIPVSTRNDGSGSTESRFAVDSGDGLAERSGWLLSRDDRYIQAWICSVVASIVVGMAGIFPLLLPIQEGPDLQKGGKGNIFNKLLKFNFF